MIVFPRILQTSACRETEQDMDLSFSSSSFPANLTDVFLVLKARKVIALQNIVVCMIRGLNWREKNLHSVTCRKSEVKSLVCSDGIRANTH